MKPRRDHGFIALAPLYYLGFSYAFLDDLRKMIENELLDPEFFFFFRKFRGIGSQAMVRKYLRTFHKSIMIVDA